MELWIRSQGNYEANITPRLIKANDISLDYCGENDSYYILVNNGIEVAYYNSEKRALEILDEIQKKINLINLGHDFGSPMTDLNNPTYIYEMPKK